MNPRIAFTAALAVTCAVIAGATPVLPDASWSGNFRWYNSGYNAPTVAVTGSSLSNAGQTLSASGNSLAASLAINSTITPALSFLYESSVVSGESSNFYNGGNSDATLHYSFAIDGPTANVWVNIKALAFSSIYAEKDPVDPIGRDPMDWAVSGIDADVRSSIDIISQSGTRVLPSNSRTYLDSDFTSYGPSSSASVSGSATSSTYDFTSLWASYGPAGATTPDQLNDAELGTAFLLTTNTRYDVTLSVSAYLNVSSFYGGQYARIEATVDPQLGISTLNLDPDQYSLHFSSGLTEQSASVPDSANSVMLTSITILGLLGARKILRGCRTGKAQE